MEVAQGKIIRAGDRLGINPADGKLYVWEEGFAYVGIAGEAINTPCARLEGWDGEIVRWFADP